MLTLRVDDVFTNETYQHIDVFVHDMPVFPEFRNVKFKIYATNEGGGLEFRIAPGWPEMFVRWPGQTQDSYGPLFRLSTGPELEPLLRSLHAIDRYFIRCLVDHLPSILEAGMRATASSVWT